MEGTRGLSFPQRSTKWAQGFLGLALSSLPAQGPQRVLVQKTVVLLHRANIQGEHTFCVVERSKDESGRGSEMAPDTLELWEWEARKKGSKKARATVEGKARNRW